jgi:protein-tyrosine phosphatase
MKLLFVCTGNICRSPTAAGVFAHLVREAGLHDRISVESAGTHGYHAGQPPDERAQRHAKGRGYDLSALRARQVSPEDFERFDLILAMDRGHQRLLRELSDPQHRHKIRLLVAGHDVPDPYYGGPEGFESVLDMVEAACFGLLDHVRLSLKT